MGTLARVPLGPAVIDFLGHMRPDPRLARKRLGIVFPTAVGLGAGVDPEALAAPAFARFGFGFLEIGPVTLRPVSGSAPLGRDLARQAVEWPDPPDNLGATVLAERLARDGPWHVPLVVRLATRPDAADREIVDDLREMAEILAPHASALSFGPALSPTGGDTPPPYLGEALGAIREAARGRPVLLALPADLDLATVDRWAELAPEGLLVDGSFRISPTRRRLGVEAREPAIALVRTMRELRRSDVAIIASGGVHEPIDALRMLGIGADLVVVDSGLLYGGPGLPKRINDAVLALERGGAEAHPPPGVSRPAELSWFWTFLLGLGMLVGSLLALGIAATRVMLLYDEWFVGLTRAEIAAVNPRLLHFLAHDRVTLGGVMTTIGVIYTGLSWFGVRRGWHWAYVTIVASASVGFASFFLFLGFGYFDPFHAFVTAVLLQLLLLAVHSKLAFPEVPARPGLFNDRAWRMSLWGQLLVIVQANLFLAAGVVISCVGVTEVFVPEDLAFMQTTAEALRQAGNQRLVPMVAHDRASLGGMLIVAGLAFLMPALWGYRRGARWLWWTLLLAAIPGFAATIVIHLHVGYINLWHLSPAFVGMAIFAAGFGLSYPYFRGNDRRTNVAWEELRRARSCVRPGGTP
jgi:dihydroorotate dehydrogenase